MISSEISVVIRTKNSAVTIEACLQSLRNQSIKVAEIIIVDSGSTDATLKIAKKYQCKILHYPIAEEFNYSKALNLGIEESNNENVLNLSSHVILMNEFLLEKMLSLLVTDDSCCAVGAYAWRLFEKDAVKFEHKVYDKSNFKGFAMSNSLALIKKTYWKIYSFNENIPASEDQDWAYYFIKNFDSKVLYINSVHAKYANPYDNLQKRIYSMLAVGRYVYPPFIAINRVPEIFIEDIKPALLNFEFKKVVFYLIVIFVILLENIGFKIKIHTVYNSRLKKVLILNDFQNKSLK